MNNIIKRELEKCRCNLPQYDDSTTKMFIPKNGGKVESEPIEFKVGENFIIRLAKYILYPPENFTLDSNWNKGVHPKSEYMLVTPIKFVGKMIQFDGCGYDYSNDKALDDLYSGLWLPSKGIEIVEQR